MSMQETTAPDEQNVLMTIQNNRNPSQVIYLVFDGTHRYLQTNGLREIFGLKEILLETSDVVQDVQEYAALLGRIMEMISAAEDLHLPFRYQEEFEFNGQHYTLEEQGEFRVLKKVPPPASYPSFSGTR